MTIPKVTFAQPYFFWLFLLNEALKGVEAKLPFVGKWAEKFLDFLEAIGQ